jgi:hypothetical protein
VPVTTEGQCSARTATRLASDHSWLSRGLVGSASVVAVIVGFVVAVHVDDRYNVDHASGARIALARYASGGVLYPPLVGEGRYGGTRFMPLPIVLHAAASRITGEYLISGKLVAALTMLAVLSVVYWILRRGNCPRPLALGLLASVLATQTGLLAITGLRADSLPLLLQLLVVALIWSSRSGPATWSAAVFGALALVAKVHAVWAPAAVILWMWRHDRGRLRPFLAVYVGCAVGMIGLLVLMTDGRFSENMLGLSAAGVTGYAGWISSPNRLVHLLVTEATATWLLLPIALVTIFLAMRRRAIDPWGLSLLGVLAVLLVVLSDIGTGGNQLLDATVLTVLVVGLAAGRHVPTSGAETHVAALNGVVIWVLVTGVVMTLGPALRDSVETVRDPSRYSAHPLAGIADHQTSVLSEDPFVPVSLNQDPVVLDPFMLLRVGRSHPQVIHALIRRIEQHDFELVVLIQPLDDHEWWADYHFGTPVIDAVDRSYVFSQHVQGYDLYRPRAEG